MFVTALDLGATGYRTFIFALVLSIQGELNEKIINYIFLINSNTELMKRLN